MAGRKAAGKRREVLASGWDQVRGCSTLAQLLFAYARTGHQSPIVPGIGRWSMALAAEHLGCDVAEIRSAIAELAVRDVMFVDEAMGVVFIPFGCREGTPATKHYVTSWVHPLADIPACELKTRALRILATICAEKGPEFAAELVAIGGAPPIDPPSTPPVHPPSTHGASGVDHHVTGLGSPGAGDRVQGSARTAPPLPVVPDDVLPVLAELETGRDLYPDVEQAALNAMATRIHRLVGECVEAKRDGVTPAIATAEGVAYARSFRAEKTLATGALVLSKVEAKVTWVLNDCRVGKRRKVPHRGMEGPGTGGDDFVAHELAEMERTLRGAAPPPPRGVATGSTLFAAQKEAVGA